MRAGQAEGTDIAERRPSARPIAAGEGWSAIEFTCHLGPGDRPSEERYGSPTIAAVVAGTFQCRTDSGSALLYPGSFLLGNGGACFECGHEHGVGDRCVSFHFDAELFEEIAATAAGSSRFRFPAPMLPALPGLARAAAASALSAAAEGLAAAELAIGVAEAVIGACSGNAPMAARPSARDERRVTKALRYIEENSEKQMSLGGLASVACMSKYHFLHTFRRIAGLTPHQFLLATRLRQAAMRLVSTAAPISGIAYDAGFGDLSSFNTRFRHVFGMTPGALRRSRRPFDAALLC